MTVEEYARLLIEQGLALETARAAGEDSQEVIGGIRERLESMRQGGGTPAKEFFAELRKNTEFRKTAMIEVFPARFFRFHSQADVLLVLSFDVIAQLLVKFALMSDLLASLKFHFQGWKWVHKSAISAHLNNLIS